MSNIIFYDQTPDLLAILAEQGKTIVLKGKVRSTSNGYDDRAQALSAQAEELGATAVIITKDEYYRGSGCWVLSGNAVLIVDKDEVA